MIETKYLNQFLCQFISIKIHVATTINQEYSTFHTSPETTWTRFIREHYCQMTKTY